MIGVFDSGSGGLTFLSAMRRRFPEYSYAYFGDYDHCPYGSKTPEEILYLTTEGVQKLFDAGAKIVILACNTASAWSLRKLQMNIFPEKRILGVTIPGAERAIDLKLRNVTVFATEQTVNSKTYRERMGILDESVFIDEIALPGSLVQEIENLLPVSSCRSQDDFNTLNLLYGTHGWNCISGDWRQLAMRYFGHYSPQDGIILGCTHYSYLAQEISYLFPDCTIIDPSEESAQALGRYIQKHALSLSLDGNIFFLS